MLVVGFSQCLSEFDFFILHSPFFLPLAHCVRGMLGGAGARPLVEGLWISARKVPATKLSPASGRQRKIFPGMTLFEIAPNSTFIA